MSAISRGDRLIRCVSLLLMLRAEACRADLLSRSGASWIGADRSWSLQDLDVLAGSESCADQLLPQADASRSSGAGYADGCAYAQGRRGARPADRLSTAPWW